MNCVKRYWMIQMKTDGNVPYQVMEENTCGNFVEWGDYFDLKVERDALKAQLQATQQPVTYEELAFWNSTVGFPEERLNAFIEYRLRHPQPKEPQK